MSHLRRDMASSFAVGSCGRVAQFALPFPSPGATVFRRDSFGYDDRKAQRESYVVRGDLRGHTPAAALVG